MYCIVEYRLIIYNPSKSTDDFIDRRLMQIDDSMTLDKIKNLIMDDYGQGCRGIELIRIEFATFTCPIGKSI